MKDHYKDRTVDWESSGSTKGEFLFKYAQEAIRLLKNENSVKLTSKCPVLESTDNEGLYLGFFSGGTSGEPEIVKHSPSTLRLAADGLHQRLGDHPIDSACCLPLWHVGGWMQLERAYLTGGKVLFCDYRELINPSIIEKITGRWISLVPTQLNELIKFKNGIENLKYAKGIFVGGAGMNQYLVQTIRSSGLHVFPCYGCSETAGMVTLLDSSKFLEGEEGVGKALPHAKIRVDPKNRVEINAASICLSRGGQVYHRDFWLQTPDLGKIDPFGNLIILGRSDRIINTGGEKVDPAMIEKILYATGKVEECLVYGEPDGKWGQRVVACVSPVGIALEDLVKLVTPKLTGPMKPKKWKIMDRIPLSEMGKVTWEKKKRF